ncbi:hypothetical protein GLOIN_2v1719482 [Rhizophagus clarus]|uniref:Uncharacterized protein n=1 Tax=Rhizophagus clarus TaxID=94130 RepID=A0A8H3MHD5_9GLOM|nr:hypothetical protein GLOIN_2v1719482 [Rhizophagus clarus]
MVDEFNTIIKDTVEAIKDIDSHFINSINYLGEFIPERRVIVKDIEMRIEEVKKYMADRFQDSVINHSAMLFGECLAISGICENEAYKLFEKNLEMDKEKCEEVENLQEILRKSLEEFKNIRPRFVTSEYRKQNIDRKKIEVIENIMEQILGKEIEPGVNPGKNDKAHSTGIKIVGATIEGVCKLVPSPLSFYCMYRDHKETKNRDSLRDMETIIEIVEKG